MKENYSLLLMGNFYDNHMIRLVRNLKKVNPKAQIDYFAPREFGKNLPEDYLACFRECHLVDFSHYLEKVPYFRTKENIYNWRKYFSEFAKNHHYDIVNIHYPRSLYRFLIDDIFQMTDSLVLSPWGSDVLRVHGRKRNNLKELYDKANYVTGRGDRFTEDFMRIFSIPQNKFVRAGMGSETIDYIMAHKNQITTIEAKKEIGIDDCYAISCGYNASPAQHHLDIIASVGRIKSQLPDNLVLLFPLTYPKSPEYVRKLKEAVDAHGLHAVWFDHYLELPELFILRMATDMFIHIQDTDANNASLKEYLLCEKNCLNGAWLKYDDVEKENYKPYHLVNNIGALDESILCAYNEGAPIITSEVMQSIEKLGCQSAALDRNAFFMSISD